MTAMTKAAVEVTGPAEAVPYSALDTVFLVVGGVSAVWLTSLLVQLSFQWGWAPDLVPLHLLGDCSPIWYSPGCTGS